MGEQASRCEHVGIEACSSAGGLAEEPCHTWESSQDPRERSVQGYGRVRIRDYRLDFDSTRLKSHERL